jgi:hypothetical protein
MTCKKIINALIITTLASVSVAHAQLEVIKSDEPKKSPLSWLNVKNDRRYIEDHTKDLTVRAFATTKFTRYVIGRNGNGEFLPYASNDNLNIGAGFNWRFIGLNLGFKMPFVNNDNARFGKTRSFDLQSFLYFRKLQVDIYAQSYNGLYVSRPKATYHVEIDDLYPYRPDLRTKNFGINAQYIFNSRRFSYRAAFVQNEYQKKSAGSFMIGGGLYHFRVKADSAIIPANITFLDDFWNEQYYKTNVTSLALNAGYAYTFVYKKHFFITGSITAGPGLNYTQRHDVLTTDGKGGVDYQLNGTLRLAAGYNSSRYFAGVQYIRLMNRTGMPETVAWQQAETGSFRVTIAKRFKLNKKFEKKVLEKIEEAAGDVEEIIR